jgi:NAD(P)-dependent dehydrogenase (short-subunit alcohol dehydrogenase family)
MRCRSAPRWTKWSNVERVPTALITGASSGIGRATAIELAATGWTVFAGVRDAAVGEELERAAPSGRLIALQLDVTDADQIEQARVRIEQDGAGAGAGGGAGSPGALDALVNNAGVGSSGPLELISDADLRALFDVNLFAQIAVTRALLPALRRAGGRIVLVSSIGGRVAMAFSAPYAASKHALEAVGDALRVELHSSGVQVALVEPGSVATPIWDKSRTDAERLTVPSELREQYGTVPAAMDTVMRKTSERGVAPEQVAQTIARALSAPRMKARYVVGRDARAMLLAKRVLPAHIFDRFARRALGV